MRVNSLLIVVIVSVGGAWSARADVCFSISERDQLDPTQQASSVAMWEDAFTDAGVNVGGTCDDVVTVTHLRFGDRINVRATLRGNTERGSAPALEELPEVYLQMARMMLDKNGIATSAPGITRDNVTSNQERPSRVEADALWYVRLGPGMTAGGKSKVGPGFGAGYRYELDRFGIDASFNLLTGTSDGEEGGASGSLVKLMGLFFASPATDQSWYAGAGASWGAAVISKDSTTYEGSGLQVELAGGYELLRASTIRMFGEAGVTLPLYRAKNLLVEDETLYTPTFTITFGVGWNSNNNRHTVRVVD